MEKVYMNELSIDGQFESMDEFSEAAIPVMKCLKYIKEHEGKIYKYSGFFNCNITKTETWNDLRKIRGDKLTRLKSLLLSTTEEPPYWDLQDDWLQDVEAQYKCDGIDVTMSSIAEAAEAGALLVSFPMERYQDKKLQVVKNDNREFELPSAVTLKFLVDSLKDKNQIDIDEYLCNKYAGTRLDFSKMESRYGLHKFEKEEIEDCLRTFDKFVQLENWNAIFRDESLKYKKYSPSLKDDDWFLNGEYADKEIDKFRCVNPKRCFGYREGEVFYVLRMERDHKISDKG